MTFHTNIRTMDNAGYMAAVDQAERRALHSYFNQHVIEEDGRFFAYDEGDYDALPQHLACHVIHTVPGGFSDEY